MEKEDRETIKHISETLDDVVKAWLGGWYVFSINRWHSIGCY